MIAELERLYGINEDILRFIVIKYQSKKEQTAWQTLVDRANKKEKPKTLKKDEDSHREREFHKDKIIKKEHVDSNVSAEG